MKDAPGGGYELRKRFYKEVTTEAGATGFRVLLDGRGIRTPARRPLALPSRELAEAVAEEWRCQGETIDPGSMPLTRLVNSAVDGVADRMAEVRAAILAYGASDLLCYLADGPDELVARQSRRWGEIHAWVGRSFGVELELAVGVMPVAQDEEVLRQLDSALGQPSALELAALHVMTASMGSLLLSLAVLHGRLTPGQAWELAHLDEDFQIEKWGRDEEASERRQRRWAEIEAASRVLAAGGDPAPRADR
jgi:chaperone required for assembly of F1-ATPase